VLGRLALGVVAAVGAYVASGVVFDRGARDGGAARIDDYVAGEGTRYESARDGFVAEFPTEPVPTEQVESTPSGPVVFHNNLSQLGRERAFEVGTLDLGSTRLPPGRDALGGLADLIVTQMNGTVLNSAPSTLDGVPAEDFAVEYEDTTADAQLTAIMRLALHEGRLYAVAVSAPELEQEAFDRFVSTFRFTDGVES
jgi:hypothetical protein